MEASPFRHLPDELIDAIVLYLPPDATISFGAACKRSNRFAHEHLVWRRHCVLTWNHWQPHHDLREKLRQPPAQVKWRKLYDERKATDKEGLQVFDLMLTTQQYRVQRIEELGQMGYDVKDLLLQIRDHTPETADDVLARRYYADAALGHIHRATAIERWMRLHTRRMVRLEEVLGAYDLFVLGGRKGDLSDIERELDRITDSLRAADADFDDRSTRSKALEIVKYLRTHQLVGMTNLDNYHQLRNNFLSMALFDTNHASLPLQSCAIYCAVARRLGIDAKPSNYPYHVHVVIEAPHNQTLDGKATSHNPNADPEFMFLDPWRSAREIPRDELTTRLAQMGAPAAQHAPHLGPTSTLEVVMRTGRNIMNSVNEARNQHHPQPTSPLEPDLDAAWYSVLWSMMILGDNNAVATLHRRRQCLDFLIGQIRAHFPEDLGLVESVVLPMFQKYPEHHSLAHLATSQRLADQNAKPRCPRTIPSGQENGQRGVKFHIGDFFKHRRYGYEGVVIGWDHHCAAEDRWIAQMRVDELPGGRGQPFYHVLAEDRSVRYVAEENIEQQVGRPGEGLMGLAGRHFKRWDEEKKVFVSNIRDEYPDD